MNESLETYARRVGVILFLIEHELSTRYFLNTLTAEGINNVTIQRNLDHLILKFFDLDDGNEETLRQYNTIMHKHAGTLATRDALSEQARQVYQQLNSERDQRSKTTAEKPCNS